MAARQRPVLLEHEYKAVDVRGDLPEPDFTSGWRNRRCVSRARATRQGKEEEKQAGHSNHSLSKLPGGKPVGQPCLLRGARWSPPACRLSRPAACPPAPRGRPPRGTPCSPRTRRVRLALPPSTSSPSRLCRGCGHAICG